MKAALEKKDKNNDQLKKRAIFTSGILHEQTTAKTRSKLVG